MSYLTDSPIDAAGLERKVLRPSDGASVVFSGVVRDHHQGKAVESIDYEAYRPMAEKEIEKVISAVRASFPAVNVAILHRLGHLRVGDVSIVIVCTSPHRSEAFDACRAMIDGVKMTVPIWKKERGPDGEEWVGWQGGH
jgi:Molybdopterin converting factor, large subunit